MFMMKNPRNLYFSIIVLILSLKVNIVICGLHEYCNTCQSNAYNIICCYVEEECCGAVNKPPETPPATPSITMIPETITSQSTQSETTASPSPQTGTESTTKASETPPHPPTQYATPPIPSSQNGTSANPSTTITTTTPLLNNTLNETTNPPINLTVPNQTETTHLFSSTTLQSPTSNGTSSAEDLGQTSSTITTVNSLMTSNNTSILGFNTTTPHPTDVPINATQSPTPIPETTFNSENISNGFVTPVTPDLPWRRTTTHHPHGFTTNITAPLNSDNTTVFNFQNGSSSEGLMTSTNTLTSVHGSSTTGRLTGVTSLQNTSATSTTVETTTFPSTTTPLSAVNASITTISSATGTHQVENSTTNSLMDTSTQQTRFTSNYTEGLNSSSFTVTESPLMENVRSTLKEMPLPWRTTRGTEKTTVGNESFVSESTSTTTPSGELTNSLNTTAHSEGNQTLNASSITGSNTTNATTPLPAHNFPETAATTVNSTLSSNTESTLVSSVNSNESSSTTNSNFVTSSSTSNTFTPTTSIAENNATILNSTNTTADNFSQSTSESKTNYESQNTTSEMNSNFTTTPTPFNVTSNGMNSNATGVTGTPQNVTTIGINTTNESKITANESSSEVNLNITTTTPNSLMEINGTTVSSNAASSASTLSSTEKPTRLPGRRTSRLPSTTYTPHLSNVTHVNHTGLPSRRPIHTTTSTFFTHNVTATPSVITMVTKYSQNSSTIYSTTPISNYATTSKNKNKLPAYNTPDSEEYEDDNETAVTSNGNRTTIRFGSNESETSYEE